MTTIPCPNCPQRIEARWFQQHLKFCQKQPKPTPPVQVADDVDLHPRTAYEKRISNENHRRGIEPRPAQKSAEPPNEYEAKARARKVEKFVGAFYDAARAAGADTAARAVLEEMLRQVENATDAQWEQVAGHLKVHFPSSETRRLVTEHFRFQVKKFEDAQSAVAEVVEGLLEERKETFNETQREALAQRTP